MQFDVTACPKGFLPIVILKVLDEQASKEKPITCERIFEILKNKDKNGNTGFMPEYEFPVKDSKAVKRQVKQLKHAGFPIQGVEQVSDDCDQIDKNYRIGRKGIYLEKDFSDADLQMIMDAVLFSRYIDGPTAKELLAKLGALGSTNVQRRDQGIARVNGVYHARQNNSFKVIAVVQKAIQDGTKVCVKEGAYAIKNREVVVKYKKKVISPYYLAASVVDGRYYVVAYVDKADGTGTIEHLRIDKLYDAKQLTLKAVDKHNTELKTVTSLSEYISSRPYFEKGKVTYVEFKVNCKRIDLVVDAFGESFAIKDFDENYITIGVKCTQKEAYRWALEHADCVEVISPQTLRDKLRACVEALTMRYSEKEGDSYEQAFTKYEHTGTLEFVGVSLSGKKKHENLKNVRNLRLADNGLKDVSFVGNYKRTLQALWIYNNPICDLSIIKGSRISWLELEGVEINDYAFLKDLPKLKTLSLKLSGKEDYSALAECSSLESLRFTCPNADLSVLKKLPLRLLTLNVGVDADYEPLYEMVELRSLEIPFECLERLDQERLYQNNPNLSIYTDKSMVDRKKHNNALYGANAYPRKVLHAAFRHTKVHIGKKEEIIVEVEKIFKNFPENERRVAELYFKENKTKAEIIKEMSLSSVMVDKLLKAVGKKLRAPYYNNTLKKYVEEYDHDRNYLLKNIWK